MFNQNHLIPWNDMIQKTIPSGPSHSPPLWPISILSSHPHFSLPSVHFSRGTIKKNSDFEIAVYIYIYIYRTILISLELTFIYLFCLFRIQLKILFIAPTIKHLMLGQTVLIQLDREQKQSRPNLRHYPGICLEGEITTVSTSVRIWSGHLMNKIDKHCRFSKLATNSTWCSIM